MAYALMVCCCSLTVTRSIDNARCGLGLGVGPVEFSAFVAFFYESSIFHSSCQEVLDFLFLTFSRYLFRL